MNGITDVHIFVWRAYKNVRVGYSIHTAMKRNNQYQFLNVILGGIKKIWLCPPYKTGVARHTKRCASVIPFIQMYLNETEKKSNFNSYN